MEENIQIDYHNVSASIQFHQNKLARCSPRSWSCRAHGDGLSVVLTYLLVLCMYAVFAYVPVCLCPLVCERLRVYFRACAILVGNVLVSPQVRCVQLSWYRVCAGKSVCTDMLGIRSWSEHINGVIGWSLLSSGSNVARSPSESYEVRAPLSIRNGDVRSHKRGKCQNSTQRALGIATPCLNMYETKYTSRT